MSDNKDDDNMREKHFIDAAFEHNLSSTGDTMDTLRSLRIFISVAEHLSLAEAGRRLNISPTTVSRTIAALEKEVGVQLLRRTTRSVRLTDEGADFLRRCQSGVADIDMAFEKARTGRSMPRGVLTVTAPVMFGRLHVLPVVVELLQHYPELQVRLLLLDRLVRLVDEGVDIAVRIADLPDSSLHMLRVGEVRRVFSASPAYLAKHGRPTSLSDLHNHEIIWVEDEDGPHRGWGLDPLRRSGRPARLSINNADAAIAAAISGLGVVRTLSYQIAEHTAAQRLERLLTDEATPALPISLLFQSGRKDHPNVRAFIDRAKHYFESVSL